jgi:hypothetical protein
VIQQQLVYLITQSQEPVPEGFRLEQIESTKLIEAFCYLLFEGTEKDDERCRKRIERLATEMQGSPAFGEGLAKCLDSFEKDESKRDAFLRRLAWQDSTLDQLFKCLLEQSQDRIISLVAHHDPKRFKAEAHNLYSLILNNQLQNSPYTTAILRHLLSPDAKQIKDNIGISHHGLLQYWVFDKKLKEILALPEDIPETDSATDTDNRETSTSSEPSWWHRFKNTLRDLLPWSLRGRSSIEGLSTSDEKLVNGSDLSHHSDRSLLPDDRQEGNAEEIDNPIRLTDEGKESPE